MSDERDVRFIAGERKEMKESRKTHRQQPNGRPPFHLQQRYKSYRKMPLTVALAFPDRHTCRSCETPLMATQTILEGDIAPVQ